MRIIKLLFSFLISIIILVGLFLGIHFFLSRDSETVTIEKAREIASADEILSNPLSGFSQLSEEEQAAYLNITNGLNQFDSNISLSEYGLSEDQFQEITKAVLRDHPEFFYIDTISYLKNFIGTVESANINYSGDVETIEAQKEEVSAWKDQIFTGIDPSMSNYDIALYLHDYLVSTTDYDLNARNNQNILSVVEEGASVCAGYARAYQYLLNEAGIFSTYVSGNTLVGAHAWNLLEIDGVPLYVDVTWDDPSFTSDGGPEDYISHIYFGGATSDFEVSHTLDLEYYSLPVIPESSYNYFVNKDLVFNLENFGEYNRVIQTIRQAQADGQSYVEIKLENRDQIRQLLNEISYEPFLFNNSIQYIEDSNYPVITFIF